MISGFSLHLEILKKTPIPMYGVELRHLKSCILKNKKQFSHLVRMAPQLDVCSAIVVSSEWYEDNIDYVKEYIQMHLPEWKACEVYRDLHGVRIVTVVALKTNRNASSRINRRIVDRAFKNNKPICAYTRTELKRDDASAEHIIPLSNDGNNSVWNICVASCKLNNNRGNIDFWEYWRSLLSSSI